MYKQLFAAFLLFIASSTAYSQDVATRFADLVGPVSVEAVKASDTVDVRWLTWGGDVATFYANGNSVVTAPNSIFAKAGLKVRLSKGDDFVQAVRDYQAGKTPILRCTLDMLGQASEVLGSDAKTKPVVFLQLTWSAGDHIVSRQNFKSLNDFVRTDGKKTRIACQQGGPHVGLLYKALLAGQVSLKNVEIVWTQDLTGPKGPAELFRKDATIDAACVITPDMLGLTGGLDATGSGAEGTTKGAHVVVSTAQMSRATADVYVVRSDWYTANKPFVEKFVAGYLSAVDSVVALRKQFNETNKLAPDYKNLLTFAQSQFGKDVIPTLEVDGHGLLLDATFVGLPGQVSFFQDKGNLNGFEPSSKLALDLATSWGYAKIRSGFVNAGLDYKSIATIAGLKYVAPERSSRIVAESTNLFPDSNLDDRTIVSFTITFEPEQSEFSVDQYGAELNRVIENASTFGNAVIVIRGHSDPTKTLIDLIKAGLAKNVIQRSGKAGSYTYYFDGKELDLASTDKVVALVKAGRFDGADPNPRDTMQAALNLSQSRAEALRKVIGKLAKDRGVNLDITQIQPVGVGILEPLIAKPKNIDEAKKNMRVEFRVVKVPAEAVKQSDFDY